MDYPLIISIISLVVSASYGAHFIYKNRHYYITKDIEIASLLHSAEDSFNRTLREIAVLKEGSLKGEDKKGLLEDFVNANTTIYLNLIDMLFTQYLDGKLDKERFKKNFFEYLRQVLENEDMKKFFNTTTSKYRAIKKVYEEWYNLEK